MKTNTPRTIRLKDYAPSPFLIETVDLEIDLHPTETRVRSRLKVKRNRKAEPAEWLHLDGEELALEAISINGRPLGEGGWRSTPEGLSIKCPPKGSFELAITSTCSPETNKALSGLYRSRGIFCTQCEAEGFRRITYFIDRPDVLSVYTTRISADIELAPVLLGNGNLVESGKSDGGRRHYAVWHDPHPKPSYLFAMVGGDLRPTTSTFTTASGREVELRIYVEPGKEDRCAWAMDSLKRSMAWDERRFGREYDLDIFMIVAVSDFNMGAMENKGLNIFNDQLILASPDTATDINYERIESVIAHEYFHNWTGNRITCRDWFQLCLKEGLTVYRDQEFSADERSRTVQRVADVKHLRAHQFPEDAGPLAHPVRPSKYIEINNFYTATVYDKGAEVCRMLETMVGREGFRKAMDLYFQRHDGEAATVEQFIACFESACEVDLGQFMLWYEQAGTPQLIVKTRHDAAKATLTLDLEQAIAPTPGQARKKPMHIPVRLGLVGTDGADLALKPAAGTVIAGDVLEFTQRRQSFTFEGLELRPTVSILRGFSAPVNVTHDASDDDLAFLIGHDQDLFNRWQSMQTLAMRLLTGLITGSGARPAGIAPLSAAVRKTLMDENLEPAYRAMFAGLPSEEDIANHIARNVDPGVIHDVRSKMSKALARSMESDLAKLMKRHAVKGPYSPDAESAGRRALANGAFGLLTRLDGAAASELAAGHYAKARNMTDRMAALAALTHMRTPARKEALEDAYKRWKDDHLTIDKWFALQAASNLPGTLAQVEKLLRHPLFSIEAPNKVRALIGTFAMGNPVNFHRPDGKGYAFLADQVLRLDSFNPQMASRMLGTFRSWRTLEENRANLAQRELERIRAHDKLSSDVFEIVGKILD
ncbi:MAG: aminopeptidase N [Rhizobiales bacterium]|nr:aminopeptidase N [Hyphomicrobiales bacterium]